MTISHGSGVLQTSVTNAASGTTTSGTYDNTSSLGAIINAKVTNGATGPTLACTVTINTSPDGTNWYFYASQTAGTAASTAYPMAFLVPPEAIRAQVVFSGNTAQAVTVEAQYQSLTSAS